MVRGGGVQHERRLVVKTGDASGPICCCKRHAFWGWDSSSLQAWKGSRAMSYNLTWLHSPTERPVGHNVHMLLPVTCHCYCSIHFKHSSVVRKLHSHTSYCDKQSLHHSRHADITAHCQHGMCFKKQVQLWNQPAMPFNTKSALVT